MNLGLDMRLQENLAEGVIHLSPNGQVTDFNRAATPWIQYAIYARQQLRQQMAQIASGKLQAPLQIELSAAADPVPKSCPAYLCTAGAKGYALFIPNTGDAPGTPSPAVNGSDFFRLMGSQTRHELTHLRDTLSGAGSDGTTAGISLMEQSSRLSRLLIAFDRLSRLHQADAFQMGERVSLWKLTKQLVDEMPRDPCRFFIKPQVQSESELNSFIYGDAAWLETGIRTLMAAIAESAPAHSTVEMRLSLSGAYIVLGSHFSSAPDRGIAGHKAPAAHSDVALQLDADIGRQICHRVVEMHGGQLTLTEGQCVKDGVTGIESFVATFPLSAPSNAGSPTACSVCPMAMQMDKYAKDIAFLLARHPVVTKTSAQELEMLSKLMHSPTAGQDALGDMANL